MRTVAPSTALSHMLATAAPVVTAARVARRREMKSMLVM
jgi:hypothetical protein